MVARAEQELGKRLPPELRKRLLANNGGDVAVEPWPELWTLYPVLDDSDRRGLRRTASHIVREQARHAELHRGDVPERATVIAENAGGDLLLLLVAGGYAVWDHETAELDEDLTIIWMMPGDDPPSHLDPDDY